MGSEVSLRLGVRVVFFVGISRFVTALVVASHIIKLPAEESKTIQISQHGEVARFLSCPCGEHEHDGCMKHNSLQFHMPAWMCAFLHD